MFNKKRALLFVILSIFLFSIFLVTAQNSTPESIKGIQDDFSPETKLPGSYKKFSEMGESFVKREQNKSFLARSWTKTLANNKYIGPFLFYTEKFFSFFDPLWEYTFGTGFEWSWKFLILLIIWGMLVWIIFRISDTITSNKIISILLAIIITSLMGGTGVITKTVENLIKGKIIVIAFILTMIILMIIDAVLKHSKKESEEEELDRAKENIKKRGELAEKSLKEESN